MAAKTAPITSEIVKEIHTPLSPIRPVFSKINGMRIHIGTKKITCRERLVVIAIHGLSIDWKKLEFTIVKPIKGNITILYLRAVRPNAGIPAIYSAGCKTHPAERMDSLCFMSKHS